MSVKKYTFLERKLPFVHLHLALKLIGVKIKTHKDKYSVLRVSMCYMEENSKMVNKKQGNVIKIV